MFQSLNCRRVLAGISGLAAGLMASPALAEPPPETTRVRLGVYPAACNAPLYLAEELLREEGFAEVRLLTSGGISMLADGEYDFSMESGVDYLPLMEVGRPLTVLSGIHTGCFELRANDSVQSITDLRGKRVGVSTPLGIAADHLLVSMMAAYVGLNPAIDINWITNPSVSQAELFAKGEVDAFIGFPPNPGQPCVQNVGHVVINTAQDRPWSNYFCCMVTANSDFTRNNPVATKRALRAILRATDICHNQPEQAAQRMVELGFSAECAHMILNDARYGLWRDYEPEDTVRFYALRLHELGIIKKTPNEIVTQFTDWRFLDEIKRELT